MVCAQPQESDCGFTVGSPAPGCGAGVSFPIVVFPVICACSPQSCEIHVSVKQRNDALRRIPELSLSHVKAQSVLLSVVVGSWNHSFICAINKPLAEMCFNNVKDFGTYHCS